MIGRYLEQGTQNLLLRLHGAEPIEPPQAPGLYGLVQELARRAGTRAPELYRITDPAINAFTAAVSRSRSCIALTTGLMERFDREEIAAVLAYQLAQLRSGRTVWMTFAGVLALGLRKARLVRPLASAVPAFCRRWNADMAADEESAKLLGDAMPLIRALEKTELSCLEMPLQTVDPATAPLFFFNPTLSAFDTIAVTRLQRLQHFALRPVCLESR